MAFNRARMPSDSYPSSLTPIADNTISLGEYGSNAFVGMYAHTLTSENFAGSGDGSATC